MHVNIKGLVIKASDSGESGKYLTILTEKDGIITARASGGKNVGASYFRAVQLFTYSDFQLYQLRGSSTVTDARYIHSFFELSKNIEGFALASYLTELCKITSTGGEEEASLFRLLLNALYTIIKGELPLLHIKAAFELRFCAVIGFRPLFESCAVCGRALPEDGAEVRVDIGEGTAFCGGCALKVEGMSERRLRLSPLTEAVLRAAAYVVGGAADRVFAFRLDEESEKLFENFAESYVLSKIEVVPKSLPLFKSILGLEDNIIY